MNRNPTPNRKLYNADEVRSHHKDVLLSDSRNFTVVIASVVIVVLIAVLCIVGITMTFGGSHASYKVIVNNLYSRSSSEDTISLTKNELKLNSEWKDTKELVYKKLNTSYTKYTKGNVSFDELNSALNAFSLIDNANSFCIEMLDKVNDIEEGRKALALAKDYKIQNDMANALSMYLEVSEEDVLNYEDAINKAKEVASESGDAITYVVNGYLAKYDIDGARSYINSISEKLGESDFVTSEAQRIEEYYEMQNDLVVYEGHVEHLFTHCLIAFPELCYSSPSMTKSLDEDCVTPTEFTKILESLYEKNYILIDINMLINETEKGVEVAKVEIPRGKIPFVFSVDDVTYDSRKMSTGMVDRLIVADNGRVCTYTKHADGTEIISFDNEAFPIVDEFCRQHPDFTFRGARGTLCHTGFDGVLGYRTQNNPSEDVDPEVEKENARKVAEALKEEGWNFASHSYAHAHMDQMTVEQLKEDTDKWLNEVVPIVGETKVMVWPYGGFVRDGEGHKYMYDKGFKLFCGVGIDPFNVQEPDGNGIFMDRKALDGFSLRNRRDRYMYLFDTQEVWDPLRPKEITW